MFCQCRFKRKDRNKRKTMNREILKRDIMTSVFSIYVLVSSFNNPQVFTEYLHICARQGLPLTYISGEKSSPLEVLPF